MSSFFQLEFKRLSLSFGLGFLCFAITSDLLVGFAAGVSLLVLTWGWLLTRIYRWFAMPEELPPIGGAGVKGILHDVFVLRNRGIQSDSTLNRSQPYLKESLASMREAALIINDLGVLVWCNSAAEYLLSIRFSEEEGKPLTGIISSKALRKYLKAENFQKPLRLKLGPEPEFCLQFEISRFGADDRLVFVKDVTDQDKLDRMRRDFVGNVSHELRTPLTVIKGYIETLQSLSSDKDETLLKSLSSMDTQAERMENLISDLLWLSRIESVEGERKEDRVAIDEVLTNICNDLAPAWPDREIRLEIKSTETIFGDVLELRSAISNLIVNALKYSEDIAVTVTWCDSATGPTLLVRDQGIGISAKHIPRLTERFYRVDKSRSQATGGTGLGLAIVKHVAVSHHAKLFVESQIGVGSCFSLVFPQDNSQI